MKGPGNGARNGPLIANGPRPAYLPLMVAKRFVRILTIVAMLFAPLSMMGGYAAMAQPTAVTSGSHHEQAADMPAHCAEMNGNAQDQDSNAPQGDCFSDCAVTCAAISALGSVIVDRENLPAMVPARAFADPLHGVSPESADPPPRTA